MPTWEVNIRGEMYDLEAPDLDTAISKIRAGASLPQARATETPSDAPLSWGQVASQALTNAPGSAVQLGKDTIQPILHPIETAKNIYRVGSGALNKVLPGYGSAENEPYADTVGQFYKDRYGSMEGFKKTLATDPVGAAADAAMVLSGGGGVAARGSGAVGRLGEITSAAGRAVDPFVNAAKVVSPVAKPAVNVLADALGTFSGTGGQSIRTAAGAGYQGGKASEAFTDSMRGNLPLEGVVDDATRAVGNMRAERSAEYTKGMSGVAADTTPLSFKGIDKAVVQSNKVKQYRGEDLSPKTADVRSEIATTVNEWKTLAAADPAFRSAEGLDALKQKIGDIKDAQPFGSPQRKIATDIYSAVRQTITDQAPDYAKVMKGYEKASDTIEELQKTLSLNPKASVDTSLRKLQSVMRNNVNTNYGKRAELAEALAKNGAPQLMEKLAGQASNTWAPRGISRAAAAGTPLALAAYADPAMLAALPLMSPRVVGEAAHLAGQAAAAGLPRGSLNTALQLGRDNRAQEKEMRDALIRALKARKQ